MARRKTKYESIVKELTSQIKEGVLPLGVKLPSVAKICSEYGVSSITAHRSIKELEKKGLVKCFSGARGTIIMKQETETQERDFGSFACLLRPFMSDIPQKMEGSDYIGPSSTIQAIHDSISENNGRMVYHSLKEKDYENKMLSLIDKPWISGIILDQLTPVETVSRLGACIRPAIIFGRIQIEDNLSVVTPDIDGMCRKMVSFFLEKGYQRFAFYPDSERNSVLPSNKHILNDYETSYQNALINAGIGCEDFIKIPEVYPKTIEKNIPENFGLSRKKPSSWIPTAVFATNDTMASQFLEAVSKTNLKPGTDIGLIYAFPACNNKHISYWSYDPVELGIETVQNLVQRIRAPQSPPTIVKIPVSFVDNGTA